MIPILYSNTETAFTSNGIGRLRDCISCRVTEERNGKYECEFKYPVTGKRYADIVEGCFISVTHDDTGDRQPFIIYRRSAPINGVVTFNAHHVSYQLNNVVLNPFTAGSATEVMTKIPINSINTNPFTFWTDKESTMEKPSAVAADELRHGIAYLVNSSGLPAFVVAMILAELTSEAKNIAMQELKQANAEWNEHCKNEENN